MTIYTGLRTSSVSSGEEIFEENSPEGAVSEDIPLDLIERFAWENYTVKRGDSVSQIALDHSISMDAIIASNDIANVRRIHVGQILKIPNMDGIPYTVKKGDTLVKIAAAMNVPLSAILDANDIESDVVSLGTKLFIPGAKMKSDELRLAMGETFIYPIRGTLTSRYGWRDDPITHIQRFHAAIDLAAPRGTSISAAMDGRVDQTGYNGNLGNFVIIIHGDDMKTMYGHMSKITAVQGAYVRQGGKIGEVGSTGYSTGNHLHFAVYKKDRALNPLDFLN
jgi:murein DD-endopeptidase MepM/ murein hydrolase activator NlpD